MTSPDREPTLSRMQAISQSSKERLDLERKVLAAAFKLSFEDGDSEGAALAHKGLCAIIQQQLFSGDSSSGSVIPASVWSQVENTTPEEADPNSHASVAAEAAEALASVSAAAAQNLQNSAERQNNPGNPHASQEEPSDEALVSTVASSAGELGLTPTSELPAGGPANYLDFGDDEGAAESAPQQPAASQPAPVPAFAPPASSPSQLIRTQTFYQMLGVSNVSSFEEIHVRFLKIMHRLLRNRYSSESTIKDLREFREVLRTICVAHDVLKDPNTRTDYDLRQMGMRSNQVQPDQDEKPSPPRGNRLMLGELLECANILEPTELQIGLDMHKAEPGMQFGEFLVHAGFLNQEELDSAILAQRLISAGRLTVAQFQTSMWRMRDDGTAFFDTLMSEGWLSPSDILNESSELWAVLNAPAPTAPREPERDQSKELLQNSLALDEQAVAPRELTAASAVPEWANNLDWGDSESHQTAEDSAADTESNSESETPLDECNSSPNADHNGHDASVNPDDANKDKTFRKIEQIVETAVAAKSRAGKPAMNEPWTEKDALAETQGIDAKTLQAVLDACVEDKVQDSD